MTRENAQKIIYGPVKDRPRGREPEWGRDVVLAYGKILRGKPDALAPLLLEEIPRRCEWRPSPAQLEEMCSALLSESDPKAEEAYLYLVHNRREMGEFARPHPENPHVFLFGPPPMDEPMTYAIDCMGGWGAFCRRDVSSDFESREFARYYNAFAGRLRERRGRQQALASLPQLTGGAPRGLLETE